MCVGKSGCYHERLVTVQWKTSCCARLNKEGHESCRGQLSPREHLNSLGKAREIYWKHRNDTLASFLFIRWTQLGFYFQVWRRFLPTDSFTWYHGGRAGGYQWAGHPQSPKHQQHEVLRPCSIAQPSSFPKPCRTTSNRPRIAAAETWTLGFIHSSSAPQEGFHVHWNIFTGHRFQVPLDTVIVVVLCSFMTSTFHEHKHTCFS